MNATNDDFEAVFTSPRGKKVLETLQVAFDRASFDRDPYVTAYNEGRRAVLIFIRNQIQTATQPQQQQQLQQQQLGEANNV